MPFFPSNLVNIQTYFRCLLNSYFKYIFLKSWRPWTSFQNPLQKLSQRTFLDCRAPTPYPTIPANLFVKHAWWVDAYIMVTSHMFSLKITTILMGPTPAGHVGIALGGWWGDRRGILGRIGQFRPRQGFRRLNQQQRWELMGIMRFHGPEGFCGIRWDYITSGNLTLLWKNGPQK